MENSLRLEWWDPEELDNNPHNWRKHPKAQTAAMSGVLAEVGWAGAVLYNQRTKRLIDGHLRKKVTQKGEKVPVLIGSWSEEQEAKILATFDPIGAMAEADTAQLAGLLAIVQSDNEAVQALLRRTAGEQLWGQLYPQAEPPAPINKADELQKKWRTETGQLWQIGQHRLLCGDSTKADDVVRLMGGERAGLFASDPPYSVGSHPQSWGNRGAANRNKNWSGQYVEARSADVRNTEESGVELYRGFVDIATRHAIARNAPWYCWHASKRQSIVERVWAEFGAFVHQQIIWMKSRPVLTYSVYLWQHEPCLFGWIRGEKPKILRAQVGQMAGEFPTTVWEVPSSEIETDAHPTSKPCKLFALPMELHTSPATFVTSRSPAAARSWLRLSRQKRRCYAIEKSPPFVAVALERMAALGLKPALVN